jgi:UDP-glucose-4-epimerase GalE
MQKLAADAAVEPDAAGDILDVGAQSLAQIGDLVDEGDLSGEKGVGRVFDQSGGDDVGEQHRRLDQIERPVELAQHDPRHPVGAHEIGNRRALAQKLRVGGDLDPALGPVAAQDRRNLVPGADRHGRLGHHHCRAAQRPADRLGRGKHIRQIGMPVAASRRLPTAMNTASAPTTAAARSFVNKSRPAATLAATSAASPRLVKSASRRAASPRSSPHPGRRSSPTARMSQSVLVTGGAGYIGSHSCKVLARAGYQPVVFDNLSRGHREAVRWGPLVEGDLADRNRLAMALETHQVAAVMHFAAYAYASESVADPAMYYRNNLGGSLSVIEAMRETGVDKIVSSSTCATYGIPAGGPIRESVPQLPVNPYGEIKLAIERALHWYGEAYGLRSVSLRYFNAAVADSEGEIGELHGPETHLVPLMLQTALKQRLHVDIYGTDYPTADGTAVRDYIRVEDLAEARLRTLEHLCPGARARRAVSERGRVIRYARSFRRPNRSLGGRSPGARSPGGRATLRCS